MKNPSKSLYSDAETPALTVQALEQELQALATPEAASAQARFFKTGPGQYGEGDQFLGVKVPLQRSLAKKYRELPLTDLSGLLESPWHELRLSGLLIVTEQYKRAKEPGKKQIYDFLLAHLKAMNNWDLVDVIVPSTIGDYLYHHSDQRQRLNIWIHSTDLWERRIALLSGLAFIRQGEFTQISELCARVLQDKHDLIHKASGWMLREAGQRRLSVLIEFLEAHAVVMPRTMLRYAIEKLSPEQRQDYMGRKAANPL